MCLGPEPWEKKRREGDNLSQKKDTNSHEYNNQTHMQCTHAFVCKVACRRPHKCSARVTVFARGRIVVLVGTPPLVQRRLRSGAAGPLHVKQIYQLKKGHAGLKIKGMT
jgi:hypothetical protein